MRTFEATDKQLIFLKALMESSAEGMTIPEIRASIKVLDVIEAVEKAGGKVTFEDTDYNLVVTRFEQAKFGRAERPTLELYDVLIGAEVC